MTHQHSAEDGGPELIRDRVSQVYLGMLDWGATGARLRRRIDWMAEEAHGPRVLDVGCSEGILEVLLARRGIEVTGVDINADALDFARGLLAEEPDEVRERVELVHSTAEEAGLSPGSFDTVVIGETLEHVHDPAALLDGSLGPLREAGRVVITTPFGYHPHEDHYQTFCLSDFIDLMRPRCALDSLYIEEGYIRFTGVLTPDGEASWAELEAEAVTGMTEEAFLKSQTGLYGRMEQYQKRIREVLDRTMQLQRQVELERVASSRLKKGLDAKTGEARVLRHRLHATRTSTSFLAGSTMVRAAKQPHTLWKLPFELLRLYRSSSKPAAQGVVETEDGTTYDLPDEPGLDPSKFVKYPPLAVPEAKVNGPTVAAILDTFTEHSFRYEADLLLLSRKNWRAEIEQKRPAFLLVESAFQGNSGEWQYLIVDYEKLEDNPLRELLEFCRSAGIPTVFWNKEDPPHFDDFIGAASEFDFVFTSDADCVPIYRDTLGHDRIYVLPFAAQPRLQNPSRDETWSRYPVCFAGSWIQHRYPERAESLRALLDPAVPLGLHIFDRNLARIEMGPNYRFPERYTHAIKGTLNYQEMLTAYRCYEVMLNVNTVTESPTMFSRRVLESLACGTPVISSESAGMSRMLGGHVRVARSVEDTVEHLLDLLGDEEARVREGHLAYREVHENHTYKHRMEEIFRRVGVEPTGSRQPSVSVLMPTMRPENVARCLNSFSEQGYQDKELILILNNAEFDLDAIRRDVESISEAQVIHVEGRTTLGDCLNRGVEAASGKYIAKMDDDDLYGERYLSDSVLAASFSDAEIVGKGMHFVYLEAPNSTALLEKTPEHTFTFFVRGATLLIRAEVVRDIPFDSISIKEDTNFQRAAAAAGCRIYSADRFNFVQVRTRLASDHTTQTPDAELLQQCRDHSRGLDLGRAMI